MYVLKVRKFKRTEIDGKPDSYNVSLDCTTARGVTLALEISSQDSEELRKVVSTVTGDLVEINLSRPLYANIQGYGVPGFREALEHERAELEGLYKAVPEPPGGPAPDPREESQPEALEARRAAYASSQEAQE